MSQQTLVIVISAIAAFFATLSAGLLLKKVRKNIGLLCAFSSGFFIALPLFELFPEVAAFITTTETSPFIPLVAAFGGFFFLMVIETSLGKSGGRHHTQTPAQKRIGLISTLEFCSHAFLEGLAIGVGFEIQFSLGILVTVAVVSHDFCDGLSTITLMLESGNSQRAALGMLIVGALAPILGAIVSLFLGLQETFFMSALAFLGGSFLYIGAGSLLPDALRMIRKSLAIGLFLMGFMLIIALSLLLRT